MSADDRPSAGDGVDLNLDTPALVVDAQRLEQNLPGWPLLPRAGGSPSGHT
jgi:hypothetical protein